MIDALKNISMIEKNNYSGEGASATRLEALKIFFAALEGKKGLNSNGDKLKGGADDEIIEGGGAEALRVLEEVMARDPLPEVGADFVIVEEPDDVGPSIDADIRAEEAARFTFVEPPAEPKESPSVRYIENPALQKNNSTRSDIFRELIGPGNRECQGPSEVSHGRKGIGRALTAAAAFAGGVAILLENDAVMEEANVLMEEGANTLAEANATLEKDVRVILEKYASLVEAAKQVPPEELLCANFPVGQRAGYQSLGGQGCYSEPNDPGGLYLHEKWTYLCPGLHLNVAQVAGAPVVVSCTQNESN